MRSHIAEKMFWTDKILPVIMEYGIYLLVFFLFFHKEQSLRSIGVYIPPVALFTRCYLTRQWPFNWKDPLFLTLTGLIFSAVISAALSTETVPFLIWIKKRYLKAFLIFIVTAAVFTDRNKLKKLLMLLSVLSVIFIFRMYYDFITKAIAENHIIILNNVRDYSSILAFLLPFVPFALLTSRNSLLKITWALLLCTGFSALLLTGFRGGWVSFFVSMGIWAVWYSVKVSRKIIVIATASLVLIIFLILTTLPSSHIVMRIKQGFSTTYRYELIWKPYITMYSNFPVINKLFGQGMTNETMYKYHEAYRKTIDDFPDLNIPFNPHNQYINILFRQGIVGFTLYVSLIIFYVIHVIKAIRNRSLFEDKIIGLAILTPFAGEYIVHGLVEDLRFMPFGLLLGMTGAYMNLSEDDKDLLSHDNYISGS